MVCFLSMVYFHLAFLAYIVISLAIVIANDSIYWTLTMNYFFSPKVFLYLFFISFFVFVHFAYTWHNPPFYVFELCYLENYFSLHLYKRLLTKFAYIRSLGQSVYILHPFTQKLFVPYSLSFKTYFIPQDLAAAWIGD